VNMPESLRTPHYASYKPYNSDNTESFIYAWSDTREVRPRESRAYAVLNETEQTISGGVIECVPELSDSAGALDRRVTQQFFAL